MSRGARTTACFVAATGRQCQPGYCGYQRAWSDHPPPGTDSRNCSAYPAAVPFGACWRRCGGLASARRKFRVYNLAMRNLVVSLLLLSISAFAQSAPTTSLSGTVLDPSGSVVPSANVDLTNTGTGWTRQTTT